MNFLVVDDEPLVLQDLEDTLKKIRPKSIIHGFTSAREAISFAETKNELFDVAFLDIELGYTNGIVLAKQLKKLQPYIHIIFVTSYEKYAVDAFAIHATGYLLKPVEPEALERELTFLYKETSQTKNIFIQTFGGFDVFVDGKLIHFKRAKSKELLAYLVNRKGCSVTTKEACAILFEDAPYDKSQKNYFQTIVAELKATLAQAGVQDILQKSRNNFAVNPKSFDCDYYRFMEGDVTAINQYCGDYMISYSWAEGSM
ncbi:MAG: response regulator [Oscillospiraceae bacterium]